MTTTMLHPSSSSSPPPRGGGGGGAIAAVLGRRRDLFTAAAKTRRGGRRLCDATFARRRRQKKKKRLLRRAKKTFLARKEGQRVFAEAFKARTMMMIFAASKKDEKTTKRPSSSKSLFPSVGVKLWESLMKGTNGAGGGGDDEEKKKKKNKNDDDDENFERILNSVFVSLLVTEGAIKGSAMTLLGLILHVKVIGSFQFVSGGGGVVSASDIGIACAMPLVLADFAIMNLVFPAAPSSLASAADISSPPSLTTAVSNYAKEASLNNPCVDMPFYKDAIVAIVARVADSFACVFTLGFLFTWITERGVEYGYEVYEIEQTTKWMALAAAVLGKEAMIFYQNYRREGLGKGGDETEENKKRKPAMRAYVVTRDKITGKEKMEEITAENIKAKKKRGEKLEPQELAIESAMYNINVRSTIDDWRERVSTGMLGLSFVVSGGNGVAPLVGGLLGDLLFCVYQRNNVKKYLDMYGEDDEKSSDISNNNNNNNSSSSSSSSSSSNKKNKTKKLRTSIALAKARQREMQKRQREMQNVLAKNVEKKEGKGKTSTDSGNSSKSNIITSSQKINDMIQTIQKEASLVARLVVEADAKESLLESNQTSSTPALTNAERKAYRNIEQKLPTLMTGLFEGDTPEFSEYEVAFKEAQKVLLTERHSLESKIQSFDEIIDNYRAMFALVFALEDDDEDENGENGDDAKKKKKESDTGDDDDDFEKFANFL
jgi:hypothetical protein